LSQRWQTVSAAPLWVARWMGTGCGQLQNAVADGSCMAVCLSSSP
jgi:hypothetical protein